MIKGIAVTLTLLSLLGGSEAVACYTCYSSSIYGYHSGGKSDPNCGENFKKTVSTVTHSNHCMKVAYDGAVVRTAMTSCEEASSSGVEIKCCSTDYCNASSRIHLDIITSAASLTILIILTSLRSL